MAALKVFFLVILAFSTLFNTEAVPIERSAIDDVEKLDEFQKYIQETVKDYQHILQTIVETITQTINSYPVKPFQEIQKMVKDESQNIKRLIREAQQHGKDIKNCASEQILKIQQLMLETQRTQTACTEGRLKEIVAIEEGSNVKLEGIHEEVVVVIRDIQACKNVDCLTENEERLIEVVETVGENERNAFKEGVKVVKAKSAEIVKCIDDAGVHFKAEMKKISVEVKECVHNCK